MLNKKLLAASVAALFTASANAVVNLDASTPVFPKYAAEAIGTSDLDDGLYQVTDAGTVLNFSLKVGFAIPDSTERFIRLEFTNARLGAAMVNGDLSMVRATAAYAAAPTFDLLSGGGNEATTAVFQVETTGGTNDSVTDADVLTVVVDALDISQTEAVTVTYGMYESLTGAATGEGALFEKSGTLAQVATATDISKSFSATSQVALVSQDFKKFKDGTGTAELATLGGLAVTAAATDAYLDTDLLDIDSSPVALADVLDPAEKVTFTGNFSFGDWFYDIATADCNTQSGDSRLKLTINGDTAVTANDVNFTTQQAHLCIENKDKKDVILRGSYSALSADNGLGGTLGAITYDTTSVALPYVSTFSGVNQRIYLINSSSQATSYSTSFRTEAGVTAVAGSMATGSVPANSVLAIKASDLVTLTGGNRTSATIEAEALSGSLKATTQIVNKSTGGTDTLDLVVTAPQ